MRKGVQRGSQIVTYQAEKFTKKFYQTILVKFLHYNINSTECMYL